MGKAKKKANIGADLGFEAMLPEPLDAHPITAAMRQVEAGLEALQRALLLEAQDRAEDVADILRARLRDAEESLERVLCRVPGIGPSLVMGLQRVAHPAKDGAGQDSRPTNDDDRSENAQLEPGGVASRAYLEHVGLA